MILKRIAIYELYTLLTLIYLRFACKLALDTISFRFLTICWYPLQLLSLFFLLNPLHNQSMSTSHVSFVDEHSTASVNLAIANVNTVYKALVFISTSFVRCVFALRFSSKLEPLANSTPYTRGTLCVMATIPYHQKHYSFQHHSNCIYLASK